MPVLYNCMLTIDINCDLGEGFPNDSLLMPFISSANIALRIYAGDTDTIKRTIENCVKNMLPLSASGI